MKIRKVTDPDRVHPTEEWEVYFGSDFFGALFFFFVIIIPTSIFLSAYMLETLK